MKTIKYILIALVFPAFLLGCSEDTIDDTGLGTITGKVVEEGTNQPVENARISTNPASSTVFTDENGDFVLNDIPAEDYSVEARKEGLLTQFQGASVMADATVNVIFEMQTETSGNRPPGTPTAVSPVDKAQGVEIPVVFTWTATDPEEDDLTYQLEIRNDQDEEIFLFNNIQDTTYTVEGLDYGAKYFWQVRASDDVNQEVLSPLYSFRTMDVPENNRILFTRIIGGNSVIYARDMEENEYQITSPGKNSFRPRKSNSGNKIAFLRVVNGQTHIFTMNPDGTQQRQVTSDIPVNGFNLNQLDFSWANDGATLLYPNFDKLYRVNASGGGTAKVYQTQNGKFITEVDVSEDNEIIALITNNSSGYNADIFTINFNGNILTQVMNNVTGAVGGLDLSIRGNMLLYTHDVSGYESNSYRRLDSRLFLYNLATGETTDLSLRKPDGTNDLDPRFSPNEAEVVFVNTSNDEISQRDIYTIRLEDYNTDNESRSLLIENGFMPDWE